MKEKAEKEGQKKDGAGGKEGGEAAGVGGKEKEKEGVDTVLPVDKTAVMSLKDERERV